MNLRKVAKEYIFTLLKTLNPKYYADISRQEFAKACQYFLFTIFFAFILMSIISIPKIFIIKSDIDKSVVDISRLELETKLETIRPILIPQDRPIISLDTTNNRTFDRELVLVTQNTIQYKLFGKKHELKMQKVELNKDKNTSKNIAILLAFALIPSLLTFFYIAYLVKYLLIIIPLALITFVMVRLTRKKVSFRQVLALAFYTSTAMILLEILTIPFFIKDYMLTYSVVPGVNFSILAITVFLTLFVTSVRMACNQDS